MQIIPVIDICRGNVVHAKGGNRQHYPPLESVITQYKQPLRVVEDLLNFYQFNTIYIADLDGIFYQAPDMALYHQLTKYFPNIMFWIDVGIQTKQQWTTLNEVEGIKPIIASESLQDIDVLKLEKQGLLSLDFQHGECLGKPEIWQQSELWLSHVIAMNLDKVGAQSGPDIALLQEIRDKRNDVEVIAAGGIRSLQDLKILKQEGTSSVLVASALHNGDLSVEMLREITNTTY